MKAIIIIFRVFAAVMAVWRFIRPRPTATVQPEADSTPKKLPVPTVVPRNVTFTLPDDRKAQCGEQSILLPQGTEVTGVLELRPSNDPLGVHNCDNPFLNADLVFTWKDQKYLYSGFISKWDLWAPNGAKVAKEQPDFRDDTGQLDGMMDDREDWLYVLPDGSTHTNRLKYTSFQFWVMLQSSSLAVKCRYYDQNSEIADYVTIFYKRPLAELLLLKDTRIFLDATGNPEDYSLHDGETITLKRL
jgi:hypothetical protein